MRKMTVKRCVMSGISLLIVLFVFLSLSFALTTTLGVSESGYQLLDFRAVYVPAEYGWMNYVFGSLSVFYLFLAAVLLAVNLVALFLFGDRQLTLVHFFTIGISAMVTVAYTLEGLAYTVFNIVIYRSVFLTCGLFGAGLVASAVAIYFMTEIFLTRALRTLGEKKERGDRLTEQAAPSAEREEPEARQEQDAEIHR